MKIAAIVLNWCDPEATIRCVETLRASFPAVSAVHVVDNASPDGSYEVLKNRLPDCDVFKNEVNSGYTGGNNVGLVRAFDAGCDAALILNNDVIVRFSGHFSDWVSRIVSEDALDLIGIPVYDELQQRFTFPSDPGRFVKELMRSARVPLDHPFCLICGCALLVTRRLYAKIGGLDERLFMYCEELDYSVRAAMAGGAVISGPVEIGHVVRNEEPGDRRPYVYFYQARNLVFLAKKYGMQAGFFGMVLAWLASMQFAIKSKIFINVVMSLRGAAYGAFSWMGRVDSVHQYKGKAQKAVIPWK